MSGGIIKFSLPFYWKILIIFTGVFLSFLKYDSITRLIEQNFAILIVNTQLVQSDKILKTSNQMAVNHFVQNYPQDSKAQWFQGLIAYKQNDLDTMIASMSSAASSSPGGYQRVFDWIFVSGNHLLRIGNTQKAELIWMTARKVFPTNASAYFGLGKVLISKNAFGEAETVFREGIKQDPKEKLLGLFYIGQLWIQANQFDKAIPPLLEIIQNEQSASTLDLTQRLATNWALGVSYNSTNKQDQAINYFLRTIELDPQAKSDAAWAVCDAALSLGNIFRDNNDLNKAKSYYKQVMSICKDTSYSHKATQAINKLESP